MARYVQTLYIFVVVTYIISTITSNYRP